MKKNYITPEMDILKAEAQAICLGSPELPITEEPANGNENLAKPGMSIFDDEPVAVEE